MSKKHIAIILSSLGIILIYFVSVNAGTDQAVKPAETQVHGPAKIDKKEVVTLSEEEIKKIDVRTVRVKRDAVQSFLGAMGKVQASPDKKAIVGYSFPGRIVKIRVSIGQWVKKGQALLTLECEEVGAAKSEFYKAYTEHRLTTHDFEREERLFKKDVGARKDYLEAKARHDIAHATLETARKKLEVMGFGAKQIDTFSDGKHISSYIDVAAPVSGRVAVNNAVLGAMVEPASQLMMILDPTSLCIDADIYEKDLARVKIGQSVRISVPAYPQEVFVGRLSYIGDVVHPQTRTITVRTKVENPEFKLKPGMFADIDIRVNQRKNAVMIPVEAVLTELDRKIVFVREGGHFVRRLVHLGAAFNGRVEIKQGLKPGEALVVEGQYQMKSRLQAEQLSHSHTH